MYVRYILNVFFSIVPSIFGSQQRQHLDLIKQMLGNSLTDMAHQNVRFTAVRATCAFILSNEKDSHVVNHFKDTLPHVLQVRELLISVDFVLWKIFCSGAECGREHDGAGRRLAAQESHRSRRSCPKVRATANRAPRLLLHEGLHHALLVRGK